MGIKESNLDKGFIKEISYIVGIRVGMKENKNSWEEKSQINTPIHETCFIHSQSTPLFMTLVSYTADQYSYT